MVANAAPFDAQAVGQAGWQYAGKAIAGGDGIKTGGLVALSSGLSVTLPAYTAVVNGFSAWDTVGQTITSASNAAGNPLIDRLVLRLDWTNKTITPQVKRGTAAASPVPLALTQIVGGTWEIPVAYWTVPSGGGSPLTNLVIDGQTALSNPDWMQDWHATPPVASLSPGAIINIFDNTHNDVPAGLLHIVPGGGSINLGSNANSAAWLYWYINEVQVVGNRWHNFGSAGTGWFPVGFQRRTSGGKVRVRCEARCDPASTGSLQIGSIFNVPLAVR